MVKKVKSEDKTNKFSNMDPIFSQYGVSKKNFQSTPYAVSFKWLNKSLAWSIYAFTHM